MFKHSYTFHLTSRALSTHWNWITNIKKIPQSRLYLPSKACHQPGLAVLIGWAASNHRVLKKYSAIYDSVGIPSLCVVPSFLDIGISSKGNKLTKEILNGLFSLGCDCNIIIHLFSSTPAVILPVLTQELPIYPSLRLKGIIFDSGPIKYCFRSVLNASNLSLQQGGLNWFTYLTAISLGATSMLLEGNKKRQEFTKALHSPVLDSVRQLYLCSAIDTVSPLEWVKSITQSQISLGRQVETVVWNDTEHVRHYAAHPQEYQSTVTKYLKQTELIK